MPDFGAGIIIGFIALIVIYRSVKIVPQQEAWVVETLGKFDRVLDAGLVFLIPFVQKVSYKHSLKEQVIDIDQQTAITSDNVSLRIDGVLYVRVIDAKAASYGVSNYFLAISQLAQTTMRAEIGKMQFEKTFEDREALNVSIVSVINEASTSWGVQCMRYEIKDMIPPAEIQEAMELQAKAERQKRAEILESEGKRQYDINIAEGNKQKVVLESEASKLDQINRAEGEANAVRAIADATSEAIEKVAKAIQSKGGQDAVNLQVAEKYVDAFANLAKEGNTLIVPANANDAGSMVAQALTVFDAVKKKA